MLTSGECALLHRLFKSPKYMKAGLSLENQHVLIATVIDRCFSLHSVNWINYHVLAIKAYYTCCVKNYSKT